jgi:hypothetical protein
MKPGLFPWLRIALTVLIIVCAFLPFSRVFGETLPIKEVKRPINRGEPQDPDGTIPAGPSPSLLTHLGDDRYNHQPQSLVQQGEPEIPDGTVRKAPSHHGNGSPFDAIRQWFLRWLMWSKQNP